MIRLSTVNEKIQAVLSGAVTTNQLHCVVCYSDDNGTTYVGGSQYTSTNNTTAVDICAAPGASTVRDIDFLSIRNRDTAAATVTVMVDVSATDSELVKATLAVGDQLVYTHSNGWAVLGSGGEVKTSVEPTAQSLGNLINGATEKTTPVDADMVGLMDSAASNILKKLSWANIKATLKTWIEGVTFSALNTDDLAITATGGRITGEFSSATINDQVAFVTTTTNGATTLNVAPNGTNRSAGIFCRNKLDAASCEWGLFYVTGGTVGFYSQQNSGTDLPMIFSVSGAERLRIDTSGNVLSKTATGGLGYGTGAGGTVTQATSRTTGVTLNKPCGQITMFSAAGSTTAATFTVTNSIVAATDCISVCQASGTNLYDLMVTAVAAGSFNITFRTTGGTATDAPVINFAVVRGVTS